MYLTFKRILDLLTACTALLLLLPLFLVIAVLIKLDSNGPVFFRQQRTGKNGGLFGIYKFRTMKVECFDQNGKPLSDFDRMTRLGHFVRGFSMDELPQFINIFKGEMSLIGPRPLLPEYLPYYSPRQVRRHEVLPGITGWAQINGRNTTNWEERFEYDLWYVEHISLALDIKILLMTIQKVLKREGVNQEADNTMERFDRYMIRKNTGCE